MKIISLFLKYRELDLDFEKAVKNIYNLLEEGYNATLTEMNTKDYGVAQERKRIFYIGFRND